MAEYAGLEIRIGGNTTKLTNALKAPTKAAAELQREIRQITRAMQFDPTDLKNVDTRIKITGDRMQSLQSKAQLVRTAMEQLGETVVKFGGGERKIRDIASETENLALRAKQADERFNGMTKTLAEIYEAWNKLGRQKGVDFARDQLGIDAETANRLMSTKTSLQEFRATLSDINKARIGGLDFAPVMTPDQLRTIEKLKQLDFHGMFKRGTDLDEMLDVAKSLNVAIEDSAVANVRELQKAFKDAQTEKKAFDDALSFQQMGVDLQRIDSEAESLSQTMRRLDDGVTSVTKSAEFQAIESQIRSVDAALDNVNADLERTGEAMKADPGNVQAAARYYGDLQQKAELSQQKVGLLNKQMAQLDASGASEAAKEHQDLAKWVEDSAEAARTAKKDLSDQQATVANLDDEYKTLKQSIANLKGDSTLTQYSDSVLAWQRATGKLKTEMDELKKAEEGVATQQGKLAEAQTSFDKAQQDVDEYKAKLEALRAEQKRLMDVFEQGDPSTDYASIIQRLNELETEIGQVETAYKGAQTNADEFSRKLDMQKDRAKTAQSSLEQQREKVDDLKRSVDDLAKTPDVKLFQNPTGEIERMEGKLDELGTEVDQEKAKMHELGEAYKARATENELAKTAQAMKDVRGEIHETQGELKEANEALRADKLSILNASTVKSLGMTLSATLTPALSGVGYKMVDAASTVDSAYRDMRKTVEGTEEQFEHLRSAAIEFSRTHVTSADQILSIEAIGGELGIATENLETFAEVISNIDVATNLDTEAAADALGHLSNILHLTEDDYVGFSDALVRLGNNGASTESEIANIAERIGSMGSIVGMSGADILAWSSTIASTGQNAEAAGTAISKTMSFMETAVAAAGGTMDTSFEAIDAAVQAGGDQLTIFANLAGQTADEFAEAWESDSKSVAADLQDSLGDAKESLQMIADVAHMSASDFAKTWESDPTEALKRFISGLNDIEASGGSADKILQSLGITAVRQKQGIEGLMQSIGDLDDETSGLNANLTMSRDAWDGMSDRWGKAGDAANEAAKKAEGFSGQIQMLKNNFQILLAELGEGAAPWIQHISGVVQDLTAKFTGLSAGTKEFVVAIGGIAALAGPVLSFGATLATSLGEVGKWYKETTTGLNLVKMAAQLGMGTLTEESAMAMTTLQKVSLVAGDVGLSLLKVFAAGAVIAGIVGIGLALKDLYDRYQDHIAATKGLSDALAGIGKASGGFIDEVELMGSDLRDLAADARDADGRLADLAHTIEDSNRQYGTFAGQMDYYAGVIEALGGKADRSQEETYKLEAALLAVNDACGSTYGLDEYGNVIDTQTGKVMENTDAILDNLDARKQQALVDYYSDDLDKATAEWAEANDKYQEAYQKWSDLTSDEGRQGYFDFAKQVYGSDYANHENNVIAAYEKEVSDAEAAMNGFKNEMDGAQKAIDEVGGKLASAEEEQRKYNDSLKAAADAQAELDRRTETVTADVTGNMKRMSDAATELGTSDEGFNALVGQLDAIYVSAKEMDDVDMSALVSAYSDAGSSMADIVATLEDGGVVMSTWNSALEQAPGAAENMGSVTAAAFDSMYETAGQDLNDTMTLIAGLDMVQVGDKTFYVGDNGSIIDAQGKVYDLDADLAAIPEAVIEVALNDASAKKGLLDMKRKVQEAGRQKVNPTASLNDTASKGLDALKSKIDYTGKLKATPTASLKDYASSSLDSIARQMRSLNGKTSTVTVTTVQRTKNVGSQATGGMNSRPVIPRHAAGYIATGPTMTNQGWVGEDGIEAVVNWATGGAVVPLTNKKYMLPIAEAIADGMTRSIGPLGGDKSITLYVSCEGGPTETANAIVRALRAADV